MLRVFSENTGDFRIASAPVPWNERDGHCRTELAHYKCPKAIDFDPELPRQPTGKLYKRLLRDRYWGDQTSRIV